jgi:hypothetical protein
MESDLLPLAAMARKARIPSKWLRQEAEAGRIPHLNAGGQLLFNSQIVESLLLKLASRTECEVAHA